VLAVFLFSYHIFIFLNEIIFNFILNQL
jgi:hypothetical protein